MPKCIHCGKECKRVQARKLGSCCYAKHKNEYPTVIPYPVHTGEWFEPTEEELEKMIAEQMQCLPPWWDAETRRIYKNAERLPEDS